MKVAVGSDHAGYEGDPAYKPAIVEFTRSLGHEIIDCGTNGPTAVDYPDFGNRVAETILRGEAEYGIILCGTGIGISIAANRHPGIRAAVCVTPEMARLAREHNDANVLALGRRLLSLDDCFELISIFLTTSASNVERHRRRVEKLG